mgnify:CR=1 FL=1
MNPNSIYKLLQISDTAFPRGSFAHSLGLETYVSNNKIIDSNSLYRLIENLLIKIENFQLSQSLSMSDATNIYDKPNNTYSSGSVTITFQPNLFQTNVFRTTGFLNPPTAATYGSRVSGSVYVSE